MIEHVDVRPGIYRDSVTLMGVSRTAGAVTGVEAALIAMATELNLGFLEQMGFTPVPPTAGPNALLVALRAVDEAALAAGLQAADAALAQAAPVGSSRAPGGPAPRTFRTAARAGDLDLALVSVPGEHAFVEALDALEAGLHVLVFSDNVALDDEVRLKRLAAERDRLMMGPDAGTTIIAGVGLGFTNAVRSGPVGVVAASGTGAQQLTCLLDDSGVGVSHVLGVGGRDLTNAVGGASTLQALAALDADPSTELIVVLSKPPADAVAARVRAAAHACATPAVLGFLGTGAADLTELAAETLHRLGREQQEPRSWPAPAPRQPRSGRIVGLFAGGTLCSEALAIAPGHPLVDLGADEYTVGRPHPMIDQQLRIQQIRAAAADQRTAVLLLDVVLGFGAHPDPAGELAPVLAEVRERRRLTGGPDLAVVVSLCGAAGDPQDRDRQAELLRDAGASVHLSNAAAAREAANLVVSA